MPKQIYIGELAKSVGLNPKTIRYYEEIGLLPPSQRNQSGYRIYSPDISKRLIFIKKAQIMGLSLEEIKEVMEIRDRGTLPCKHVRKLLVQHLDELDQLLKEMRVFREEFAKYVTQLKEQKDKGVGSQICEHIEEFKSTRSVNVAARTR